MMPPRPQPFSKVAVVVVVVSVGKAVAPKRKACRTIHHWSFFIMDRMCFLSLRFCIKREVKTSWKDFDCEDISFFIFMYYSVLCLSM
jgi:hypothetical protein